MTASDSRSEFERLRVLHETGLLDAPPPPEMEAICREARDRFKVASALVTLVDRDRVLIATEGGTLPRSVTFCDWTIRADDVLVVPDLSRDARFADTPLVVGEPFYRFYAGAPLIYLRDIRLGALCLLDLRPREFTRGDRAELALLADQVVAAIARRDFPPIARLVAP